MEKVIRPISYRDINDTLSWLYCGYDKIPKGECYQLIMQMQLCIYQKDPRFFELVKTKVHEIGTEYAITAIIDYLHDKIERNKKMAPLLPVDDDLALDILNSQL